MSFSLFVDTYSLRDAARILKVSPSRLRYWKRTALAQVPGKEKVETARPEIDFRDLVCVRAMLSLVDQGIPVRRIRRAVSVLQENIPNLEDPLSALRIWAEGSPRMVVQLDGVLIEPEGQMVLDFGDPSVAAGEPETIASASERRVPPEVRLMESFERGCSLDSNPRTYADAIEAYESCVSLDPEFADGHCNLGAVLYNASRIREARRCFERCLEINEHHVEGHFNLANLLEEEGCSEMALSHYRAALRADPFYADLHINLALLYERLSQSAPAHRHWRRYLQLDPAGSWSQVARQRLEAADS